MKRVNSCYFSREEIRYILERYGRVIRDDNWKYKDKIPYDTYRALYGVDKGVVVDEFADNESLYFYDDIGDLLAIFAPGADFHEYFYSIYYSWHSDYCPYLRDYEEAKDMATTTNISYNSYAEPAYSLNDYLTWNNYDTTATSTSVNTNYNRHNDDVYINDINVEQALKDLAETAKQISPTFQVVGSEMKKLVNKNEKENKNMKGFNFDFGPCKNDNVRMSMYGIAVKNQNGEWASYNPATAQIVNVDIFNFEGGKFLFKLPVAPAEVKIGDVVIHNKKAMFVLDTDENGFVVVDVNAGEEKKIVPTANVFGFNFITKVVSMFDAFAAAPTPDAPFGNFLPFMMMGEDNKDIDPMMMYMMMTQGNGGANLFSNPMMLYMLCGDKMKDNSMLPLMFLMGQNQTPCNCHGKH